MYKNPFHLKMAANFLLKKELLSDFECPICLEYMHPPICQCTTGHSFCKSCFDRIRRCPHCRSPKSTSRSYILEKVHSKLSFPCKYRENGCPVVLGGQQIKDHEKYCFSQNFKCPFHLNDVCKWEGSGTKILPHCLDVHKNSTFFEPRRRFTSPGFSVNRVNRFVNSVFVAYGVMFRCTWDLDITNGTMRYGVYYMGKPMESKRFSYRVSFYKGSTNTEVLSMKAPCLYLDNPNLRFIGANYNLIAKYDLVKKLCDENGDLRYAIHITDNNFFLKFFGNLLEKCS